MTLNGKLCVVSGGASAIGLDTAAFPSNALTGQSIVVSHGWRMD